MQGPSIRIGKKLGDGAFSDVFRAEMTHPGQPKQDVALKRYTVEYSPGISKRQLQDIAAREYHTAKDFNHPNLIKLLAFIPANGSVMVAQELAVGGDLFDRLTPGFGIKADVGADVMCGVLNGLAYLHETANLVHLDLKPENILLGEGDVPKLADFDAVLPQFCDTDVVRGTRDIHPPELVAKDPLHKIIMASADIWSAGVLAHVLVTGTYPWGAAEVTDPKFEAFRKGGVAGGDKGYSTPQKLTPTGQQEPLWGRLPPDLANTFGLMLSIDAQNRSNARYVHDMVRGCWKADVEAVREAAAAAGKQTEDLRRARELKNQWSRSPTRRKKLFSFGSKKKKAATKADPYTEDADRHVAAARAQSGLYTEACPVCMEDFDDPDRRCRQLPCGHMFHNNCIESYLKKRTTCPVCKEKAFPEGVQGVEGAVAVVEKDPLPDHAVAEEISADPPTKDTFSSHTPPGGDNLVATAAVIHFPADAPPGVPQPATTVTTLATFDQPVHEATSIHEASSELLAAPEESPIARQIHATGTPTPVPAAAAFSGDTVVVRTSPVAIVASRMCRIT